MVVKPLVGKGLGKLPFASRLFNFVLQRIVPKGLVLIEAKAHRMYIDTSHGAIGLPFMSMGIYEVLVSQLLEDTVTKGMVFVDIGAHIGYHTLTAARLVGEEGRVFSFEPEPYNFELLVKNIQLNGYNNIVAIQKAVSNNNGKVMLFVPEGCASKSLLLPDKGFTDGEYVEVETQTLDDFFQDYTGCYTGVDVIKMDVEGAEPLVLNGMTNIIRSNRKLKIVTEFSPGRLRLLGSSPEEYLDMLSKHGFVIYNLNDMTNRIERVKEPSILIEHVTIKGSTNLYCVRNNGY